MPLHQLLAEESAELADTLARRNHKERSQPVHRSRLGLLEKHKDYVLRARDYASKQARIRKLREKAAFRNKDEFYWGMVKGETKGGLVVAGRGNEALDVDLVRVLKTQDLGWVRVQIKQDEKVGLGPYLSYETLTKACWANADSDSGSPSYG